MDPLCTPRSHFLSVLFAANTIGPLAIHNLLPRFTIFFCRRTPRFRIDRLFLVALSECPSSVNNLAFLLGRCYLRFVCNKFIVVRKPWSIVRICAEHAQKRLHFTHQLRIFYLVLGFLRIKLGDIPNTFDPPRSLCLWFILRSFVGTDWVRRHPNIRPSMFWQLSHLDLLLFIFI